MLKYALFYKYLSNKIKMDIVLDIKFWATIEIDKLIERNKNEREQNS